MKVLITGSAGHLGEALVRTLLSNGDEPVGIDINASDYTDKVGSITERGFVRESLAGVDAVIHTATLHKPHVVTHTRQDFIDTNITGTLNLLEEAIKANVKSFIFTSTTSVFGDAMQPAAGDPAVWVTEALQPEPKNIYGVTKAAAEDLCQLFHRNQQLPCIVLRTSRFFQEQDDDQEQRDFYSDHNLKVNELLFRRVDVQDIVKAHQLAIAKAQQIGFDRFIISATTPFQRSDAVELGKDACAVLGRYAPSYVQEYARRGWIMLPSIGRVYDNQKARRELGWSPEYDFHSAINCLRKDLDYRSPLARQIGAKGYQEETFVDGPYPVD